MTTSQTALLLIATTYSISLCTVSWRSGTVITTSGDQYVILMYGSIELPYHFCVLYKVHLMCRM